MCLISSSRSLIYQHEVDTGHHVGFTSREAGNMSMTVRPDGQTVDQTADNRRNLETQLGIVPGSTRFVRQTHSDIVRHADDRGWSQQTTLAQGDAIVSPDGTDPIAILVADCLPVAFTTTYGATAIAHAGRVGLLDGILQNTVQQLKALDSNGGGTIFATIGPSICGHCYEVPEQMRTEAEVDHPAISSVTSWGTPALDLPAAAEAILQNLNVEARRVNECTLTNDRLFSHRRRPGAGRLAGIVWKPQDSY